MPDIDRKEVFGIPVDKFKRVLDTYDYLWHKNRVIPSPEDIADQCGYTKKTVCKAMEKPIFAELLTERGVPVRDSSGLTAQQTLAVKLILDPTDKRTLNGKLRALGISYTTYRAWLRQPAFYNYLNTIAEDGLREHNGDVLVSLTNKAISGDINAIKYYLEVSGRHDPARQQQVNMQQVLMTIFEVLTTHITDQAQLAAIANDFQTKFGSLQAGGTVSEAPMPPQDEIRAVSRPVSRSMSRPVPGQVLSRVETGPDLNEFSSEDIGEFSL